jgi:hypothetical protein
MGGRLQAVQALFALALACVAPEASAGFGAPSVVPDPPPRLPVFLGGEAPALKYARLERGACETELTRRGVAFTVVDSARGVLAPVRLTGPLHGVTFRTGVAKAQRATSPWEIVDCRLALALDDFAEQLALHDVAQVIHFSVYRPPVVSWPSGKLASRHPGALAIDAGSFVKKDGTTLEVERDFHGHIGALTCGAGAHPDQATPQAVELRHILCDAADSRLFNVMLTPDYNRPHRNHFHLEVTAGVKWFVVH